MKEIIIGRLNQIINTLDGVHRVTGEKGSKYIQISDNAAKYMAREIKFASDYLVKNNIQVLDKEMVSLNE